MSIIRWSEQSMKKKTREREEGLPIAMKKSGVPLGAQMRSMKGNLIGER